VPDHRLSPATGSPEQDTFTDRPATSIFAVPSIARAAGANGSQLSSA